MQTDRKQELIALAFDFIAKRGYDSFSFADLALASGISKASIHHHFHNKEALGLAVLDFIETHLPNFHAVWTMLPPQFALPEALSKLDSRGNICPLSSLQAEFNVLPQTMQQRLAQVQREEIRLCSGWLAQLAQSKGVTLRLPPEQAVVLLICAVKGGQQYQRTSPEVNVSQIVQNTMELLGFTAVTREY